MNVLIKVGFILYSLAAVVALIDGSGAVITFSNGMRLL
jgi:hypothetical protein